MKKIPKSIELGLPNKVVNVHVEVSWIPMKCSKCRIFGHADKNCPKEEFKAWVPKNTRHTNLRDKLKYVDQEKSVGERDTKKAIENVKDVVIEKSVQSKDVGKVLWLIKPLTKQALLLVF